jgi:hypothetical protein
VHPACPREGETGKGAIQFLAAAGQWRAALTLPLPARLAAMEIHFGDIAQAGELIAKAILEYKTVLRYLPSLPTDFEEDNFERREGVRKLLEAIRAAERHIRGWANPL